MSLNLDEILRLCAEGLHEVLGYERVNILMSEGGKQLRFVVAAGTEDFDIAGASLPLEFFHLKKPNRGSATGAP